MGALQPALMDAAAMHEPSRAAMVLPSPSRFSLSCKKGPVPRMLAPAIVARRRRKSSARLSHVVDGPPSAPRTELRTEPVTQDASSQARHRTGAATFHAPLVATSACIPQDQFHFHEEPASVGHDTDEKTVLSA